MPRYTLSPSTLEVMVLRTATKPGAGDCKNVAEGRVSCPRQGGGARVNGQGFTPRIRQTLIACQRVTIIEYAFDHEHSRIC